MQVPRADPRRLEGLDDRQHLLHLFGADLEGLPDLLDRRLQIPVLVDRADQEVPDDHRLLVEVAEAQLLEQVVAQALHGDRHALVELRIPVVGARGGDRLELVGPELSPVHLLLRLHLGFGRGLRLRRRLGLLLTHLLLDLFDLLHLLDLVHFLQERVPLQLHLERLLELEGRHLEQLERMLETLGHDQRRLLLHAQAVFHFHGRVPLNPNGTARPDRSGGRWDLQPAPGSSLPGGSSLQT